MGNQTAIGSVQWLKLQRRGAFDARPPVPRPVTFSVPITDPRHPGPWFTRVSRLIRRDGRKCHYCSCRLRLRPLLAERSWEDVTIDHKTPKSKGGSDLMDNLVLACRKCNQEKADSSYKDFMSRRKQGMTGLEIARYLRETAIRKGQKWPLA